MNPDIEKPVVSIIMIARNAGDTIGLAVASLVRQAYSRWECVVVNDASNDHTAEVLAQFRDDRIKLIHSPSHLGRGAARNLALEQTTGMFVATLDADDFLFEDALESQVAALLGDSRLQACTGSIVLFGPNGSLLGRMRRQVRPGRHVVRSPVSTNVPLGSIMIRREQISSLRFADTLQRSEDREFYNRVLDGATLRVLDKSTYAYRCSFRYADLMEGLKNRERLFRSLIGQDPFRVLPQMLWNRVQLLLYPSLKMMGLWSWMNRWRAIPPTHQEEVSFGSWVEELTSTARSGLKR